MTQQPCILRQLYVPYTLLKPTLPVHRLQLNTCLLLKLPSFQFKCNLLSKPARYTASPNLIPLLPSSRPPEPKTETLGNGESRLTATNVPKPHKTFAYADPSPASPSTKNRLHILLQNITHLPARSTRCSFPNLTPPPPPTRPPADDDMPPPPSSEVETLWLSTWKDNMAWLLEERSLQSVAPVARTVSPRATNRKASSGVVTARRKPGPLRKTPAYHTTSKKMHQRKP